MTVAALLEVQKSSVLEEYFHFRAVQRIENLCVS